MSTSIEDRLSAAGQELDRRIAARVSAARPAADHDVARRPVRSPRPMWAWVCAGGVAIAGLVTGVVLLTRDGTRSITPATSTITSTSLSPSTSTTASSEPTPSSTSPSTSAETSAAPSPPIPTEPASTVQFADAVHDGTTQRTVLYTATVGTGIDQIGREECQECDPESAWTPVALPDGTLVIADSNNNRWVVVRDGTPATYPFPDGRVLISQPVADDDGTIYVVDGYYQSGPAKVAGVSVYRNGDMSSPSQQVEVPAATVFSSIQLTSTAVLVNGRGVPGLQGVIPATGPRPEVTYSLNQFPATVTVVWDGRTTVWMVPPTDFSMIPLQDNLRPGGIILFEGYDSPTSTKYLVSLHPDGTAVRAKITGINAGTNGSNSADATGIVHLEWVNDHFEVAHYTFPN